MKWFRKIIILASSRILLIILSGIVFLSLNEIYLYVTRSEEKAQVSAQMIFIHICERQRLDPTSFRGPDRPRINMDEEQGVYTFMWTRSQEETITVTITYMPYDYPYSLSNALSERNIH